MTLRTTPLTLGEPVPWFVCRSSTDPSYPFGNGAGRYVVLCFFGSAGDADSQALLAAIETQRALFNDESLVLLGVSTDAEDERLGRVAERLPGIHFLWDFDLEVSGLCGVIDEQGRSSKFVYVLDLRLRVLAAIPMQPDVGPCVSRLMQVLQTLPPIGSAQAMDSFAPVLVVPRVFSTALCRSLIETYEQHGGTESGFMRDVDGKTVLVNDRSFKRRRDYAIADHGLRQTCIAAIRKRLLPQIQNAFQFDATRIERHLVSCYDAREGGRFSAHRDNTTLGTAHRRFAVSLFLNTGDYEGGMLRFPEYGPGLYSAPAGGAVVFSCSLLHEAMPVTCGRRFMYLPFLYDEPAAEVRQRNRHFLQQSADQPRSPARLSSTATSAPPYDLRP